MDQTLSQQQQQLHSSNNTSGNPLSAIGKQLGGVLGLGDNK
ncbi:MAG: hypothetical protein ACTHJ7_05410 [Candidatus Nitrosocosmicus sp.]